MLKNNTPNSKLARAHSTGSICLPSERAKTPIIEYPPIVEGQLSPLKELTQRSYMQGLNQRLVNIQKQLDHIDTFDNEQKATIGQHINSLKDNLGLLQTSPTIAGSNCFFCPIPESTQLKTLQQQVLDVEQQYNELTQSRLPTPPANSHSNTFEFRDDIASVSSSTTDLDKDLTEASDTPGLLTSRQLNKTF